MKFGMTLTILSIFLVMSTVAGAEGEKEILALNLETRTLEKMKVIGDLRSDEGAKVVSYIKKVANTRDEFAALIDAEKRAHEEQKKIEEATIEEKYKAIKKSIDLTGISPGKEREKKEKIVVKNIELKHKKTVDQKLKLPNYEFEKIEILERKVIEVEGATKIKFEVTEILDRDGFLTLERLAIFQKEKKYTKDDLHRAADTAREAEKFALMKYSDSFKRELEIAMDEYDKQDLKKEKKVLKKVVEELKKKMIP